MKEGERQWKATGFSEYSCPPEGEGPSSSARWYRAHLSTMRRSGVFEKDCVAKIQDRSGRAKLPPLRKSELLLSPRSKLACASSPLQLLGCPFFFLDVCPLLRPLLFSLPGKSTRNTPCFLLRGSQRRRYMADGQRVALLLSGTWRFMGYLQPQLYILISPPLWSSEQIRDNPRETCTYKAPPIAL